MFRGCTKLSLDDKGRMAVPSRYRDRLVGLSDGALILTLNPLDRSLWLYPLPEWEIIETKLAALSDFEKQGRRAKQMMRGYATDCQLDGQGRILLPTELREYAGITKHVMLLGQGNKFELWDEGTWQKLREEWLSEVGNESAEPADSLKSLSL